MATQKISYFSNRQIDRVLRATGIVLNDGQSALAHTRPATPPIGSFAKCVITSNCAGGEIYNGKMITGFVPAFDPSVDFVDSILGTPSEVEDCYFINPERPGETGTHVITEGDVFDSIGLGHIIGFHTDFRPIILGWSLRTRDCVDEEPTS